jgi:hypothetical protein
MHKRLVLEAWPFEASGVEVDEAWGDFVVGGLITKTCSNKIFVRKKSTLPSLIFIKVYFFFLNSKIE